MFVVLGALNVIIMLLLATFTAVCVKPKCENAACFLHHHLLSHSQSTVLRVPQTEMNVTK